MKDQNLGNEIGTGTTRAVRLRREAQILRCLGGRLWVTLEGEARDFVMKPGDSLVVRGPGRLVMLAVEAASFTLAPAERASLLAA